MSGRLAALHRDHGQSAWIDNLQRRHLVDGTLEALVARGVRGLTSNPTIFQKAIKGSPDYDEQFRVAVASGLSPREAYWDLVVADIVAAADVFAPVHRASDGVDGFVSVEVDPSLARDTRGTLEAAVALHERIARPNAMIKVPATREGLPVVTELVAQGRSVNVTLIFSVRRHIEVMEAYLAGLEEGLVRGNDPSRVASVASFFISRVDAALDPLLRAAGTPEALELCGRGAVAQARLAYDAFLSTFSGERWERLAAAGARVQRPLWASTSTKDPTYPDTMYVDELVGPHTVNTLPESTLEAFDDHGTPASMLRADVDVARARWEALADFSIDTDAVADRLEAEGVASFIDSFEDLIASLEEKARG